MAWTDGLLAIVIVGGFFYMIYFRLAEKYPKLEEKVNSLFHPLYLEPEIKLDDTEVKKQIWNENRVAI